MLRMLLLQRFSTSWSQRRAKVPSCWFLLVFVCVVVVCLCVYPWTFILGYTRKSTMEVESGAKNHTYGLNRAKVDLLTLSTWMEYKYILSHLVMIKKKNKVT